MQSIFSSSPILSGCQRYCVS